MDENRHRSWDIGVKFLDVIIKLLTFVAVLVGFIFSVQTLKENYRVKFWEKRLSVYSDLLKATSTIANTDIESVEFKKAKENFLILYHGESQLVETKEVKDKIFQFKELTLIYENSRFDNTDSTNSNTAQLKKASLQLGDVLKKSLQKYYGED